MAKKKRKRDPNKPNPGLTGEEKQQRRQERLEARRQAKLEEAARARKIAARERFVRFALLALLGFGIFWFIFLRGQGPSEINGHEVQSFSSLGSGDHTDQTVSYETTPPVSGAHAPSPLPCGTYGEEISNEVQVHMLEHGAIGILFQPTLPPEDVERIEDLVSGFDSHVFSAPYAASPSPISVTAWGKLMRLDEVEPASIREFVDAFQRKGPERQPCDMSSNAHFEPAPEGSPAPEATVEIPAENEGAEESPGG